MPPSSAQLRVCPAHRTRSALTRKQRTSAEILHCPSSPPRKLTAEEALETIEEIFADGFISRWSSRTSPDLASVKVDGKETVVESVQRAKSSSRWDVRSIGSMPPSPPKPRPRGSPKRTRPPRPSNWLPRPPPKRPIPSTPGLPKGSPGFFCAGHGRKARKTYAKIKAARLKPH